MRRRDLLGLTATGTLLALTGCGTNKGAAYVDGKLTMAVVTTYGTGTSTYADMAAVASAITDVSGIRTRIMTSDTAIGRISPVREGQATFSRTGDDYIFAFEADHEFASKAWGPQPTRVVWAPTAPHGLLTREDTGIRTLEDLRGKKIPRITANPSVNTKIIVALTAAGLTESDVEMVPISYGEQADGLKAGKIDILFQQVYGSSLFELESATKLRWIEMRRDDAALEKAIDDLSPSLMLGEFTGAPGQAEGHTDVGYIYAVPIITYAQTEVETVREFVTAILDSYDGYKDATRTAKDWSPESAITEPQQVPFHEGLVRVLEERDLWTATSQKRQETLLERERQLRAGWKSVTTNLTDTREIAAAWSRWKEDNDV
ncbi:TAXI family TRAP transporter solute-binding subunit [Janibacter sp. GS2]|uniref:TAXI family TRAP transporter solute-binding subunit n=1 Tax=Janibacter sp. GS2 TaxID=3442646 RepID=UPI003EBD141B